MHEYEKQIDFDLKRYGTLLSREYAEEQIDSGNLLEDFLRRGMKFGWWNSLNDRQIEHMRQLLHSGCNFYTYNGYSYAPDTRELTTPKDGLPIRLRPAEAVLFEPLIALAPFVVSYADLEEALEKSNHYPHVLTVDMVNLRRTIGHSPERPLIITVRRSGYKFDPPKLAA